MSFFDSAFDAAGRDVESGAIDAETFLEIADHTLLDRATTRRELDAFLASARELGVKRVCISPSLLPIEKHGLEVVTVVGFPSGAHHAEVKAVETRRAVADDADEIDMVVNLGLVHSGEWEAVADEIRAVRDECPGLVLKVIIEAATLNDDEIVNACRSAQSAGADYVKTSTGFHKRGGASVHAVRLMSHTVAGALGVKASGGVRTVADVRELLAAGATRFGVSGTAAILRELREEGTPQA